MNDMGMDSASQHDAPNSKKIGHILISALIFGFGWHIRGSGKNTKTQ